MATVLIVEDETPTRRGLTKLLHREGYDVLTAADAFEAMAAAKKARPSLMLLDVMIPPMDGLTFLMLLREASLGYDLPVVVITGLLDDQTVARAKELGVKDYLVKSQFTPQQLLESIRQHLRPA